MGEMWRKGCGGEIRAKVIKYVYYDSSTCNEVPEPSLWGIARRGATRVLYMLALGPAQRPIFRGRNPVDCQRWYGI